MGKKPEKFRVYLAGPIGGCNDAQRDNWRQRIKDEWGDRFEFIDPADRTHRLDESFSPKKLTYEAIKQDANDIDNSHAVLANMWKESIGTTIGVVRAYMKSKPVVVVDRNLIHSRMLAYYASYICETEKQGIKHLATLLDRINRFKTVVKRKGKADELFNLTKLTESIRHACQAAGKDDVMLPPRIVPLVLENMEKALMFDGTVTTTIIRNTVWEVLEELESDPLTSEEFSGIREAWERHEKMKPSELEGLMSKKKVGVSDTPLNVHVESRKSHTSIWDKSIKSLADIPSSARPAFEAMACVEGIKAIFITQMKVGSVPKHCYIEIDKVKHPGYIDGRCHDKGKKGNIQVFQVVVHDEEKTSSVQAALIESLEANRFTKNS